ncbi:MAG: T9SS type A sorting domain-containing protein [Saprospiraceae bacterium]|nr:T9SS type A sorting domain-containing protein [Saprospiraceae bacterium]
MEVRQKEAIDASKSLTVFPNPANDFVNLHLNINFNETDKVETLVYNQLGSVMANTSVGRLLSTLNVESLRSGLYHITVQVNNNFYSSTFTKN